MSFSRLIKAIAVFTGVIGAGPITARELYSNSNTNYQQTNFSTDFINKELNAYHYLVDELERPCINRAEVATVYAEGICHDDYCANEKAVDFFLKSKKMKEAPNDSKILAGKKDRIDAISKAINQELLNPADEPVCLPFAVKLLQKNIAIYDNKPGDPWQKRTLMVTKFWSESNPVKGKKLSDQEQNNIISKKYATFMPSLSLNEPRQMGLGEFGVMLFILLGIGVTLPISVPVIVLASLLPRRYIAGYNIDDSMKFYSDLQTAESESIAYFKQASTHKKVHMTTNQFYIFEFNIFKPTGEVLNILNLYESETVLWKQNVFSWTNRALVIDKDFTESAMHRLEEVFQKNKLSDGKKISL